MSLILKSAVIIILCLISYLPFSLKAETINVAVGEWPPYIAKSTLGYGKTAQTVIHHFNERGVEIKLDFMPWKRAFELTRSGNYVATFPWAFSKEREKDLDYSEHPVQTSLGVAFYRKDRFPSGVTGNSLKEIVQNGYKIVGVNSYARTEEVARFDPRNLHIVSNAKLAWKILESGRADILFGDLDVGRHESVEFLGDKAAHVFGVTDPLIKEDLYILFSRKHPDSKRIWKIWETKE